MICFLTLFLKKIYDAESKYHSVIHFECKLFLIVSYFDDIFGPQISEIYPPLTDNRNQILLILKNLMDVVHYSNTDRKRFIYADEEFISQNIFFRLFNDNSRDKTTDFLVSLLVLPNYSSIIAVLSSDWTPIYALEKESEKVLEKFLVNYDNSLLKELIQDNYNDVLTVLEYNLENVSPESYIFRK